ncbi:hypothetical protein OG921_08355 [Aldersonia sp. NBC_00410]|uniref:Clp protease N-terminal domain-containing protein n=1 Tax=Aldersonia sp. NBC_00410 TaxID=2975954 RepID=UPI002250516D|nr:Clp protease N-terminal domain-containing protein [Aldersonia sp. NBC_00410]MCX5043178.1 hypothetical protein [Aldersonia sp. NBC_00410]
MVLAIVGIDAGEGTVFEKFDDEARRVVAMSYSEASRLGHDQIGPEHLLLGLTAAGTGPVSELLAESGVTGELARTHLVGLVGSNPTPTSGHLPFTESAKSVLSRSFEDAQSRGEVSIGSANLLRVVVATDEGAAAEVLSEVAGANLAALRERVGAPSE